MLLDVLAHGEVRDWFKRASASAGEAATRESAGEGEAGLPAPGMAMTAAGRWVRAQVHPAGDVVIVQLQPEESWAQAAPVPHEVLRDLIDAMREPLASVRAAAETMSLYPTMDAAARSQFMDIIETQTDALSDRLSAAVAAYAELYREAGPLHPIDAAAFVQAVTEQLSDALEIPVRSERARAETDLTVMLDPEAMTAALAFLVRRIENAARCTSLRLRVGRVRSLVAIDLVWSGSGVTASRLREWEEAPLTWGDSIVEMTLAEILDHHDAQLVGPQGDEGEWGDRLGREQEAGGPAKGETESARAIRLLLPAVRDAKTERSEDGT
jgi:DNA polymerase-3 subunit epsilon